MRIGWFTQTRRFEVASMRYRCWHMAWALEAFGVESRIYTKAAELEADLALLDAVVIVKRLDEPAEQVAAAVKGAGRAVFLDLCDDLMSAEYKSDKRELHRRVFAAIGPQLDALTTPTAMLAGRLSAYPGAPRCIQVIPDMAETRQMAAAVSAYAAQEPIRTEADAAPRRADPRGPRRVVWFGNHGAPHSNFGMLSLIAAAPALRETHAETPLELTVVSNHADKFEVFVLQIGVPCRYVSWTPERAYEELAAADVALLTNGDDDFSQVKSANRALQALAAGVPVVANNSPALKALGDAVALDDLAGGLRLYLQSPEAAARAVAFGQRIIDRDYAPAVVAAAWATLLRGEKPAKRAAREGGQPPSRARILVLIDRPQDLAAAAELIAESRRQDLKPMVMVTADLRGDAKPLIDFLAAETIIPTMASAEDLRKNDARWLRAAEIVATGVRGDSASAEALALADLAAANGVRLIHYDEPVSRSALAPS